MIDKAKCSHPFRTGTAAELAKGGGVCSICGTQLGQNPVIQAVAETLMLAGHGEAEALQLAEQGYRNSEVDRNSKEIYPGVTPNQLDDMAFGYCPSGKIGELREFADVLINQVLDALKVRTVWRPGKPPSEVGKAWLRVRYPNPKGDIYQVELAELNGGEWWSIYEERHGMEITGEITGWQPFVVPDIV